MKISAEENKVIDEALSVLGTKECIERFARKYSSAVAIIRENERKMTRGSIRAAQEEIGELRVAVETMAMFFGADDVEKYTGRAIDILRLKIRLRKVDEPIHDVVK